MVTSKQDVANGGDRYRLGPHIQRRLGVRFLRDAYLLAAVLVAFVASLPLCIEQVGENSNKGF
jgi:hypothetical protein